MLKAIIVDDEYRVCQLIKKIVDWDKLNIEIAATASDGNTALDSIITHKPDIVITDIRMPGLDGIELVEQTHQKNLSPNFIIISGYRDFDYAHNALKLGVKDYLLKPINKGELENVLKDIKKSYNQIKDNPQFYNSTILYPGKIKEIIQEEIEHKYKSEFDGNQYMTFYIKLDNKFNNLNNQLSEKHFLKISKILKNNFNNVSEKFLLYIVNLGIISIISLNNNNINKNIESSYKHMVDYLCEFGDVRITIGKSNIKSGLKQIPDSIQESIDAVKNRIVCQDGGIIDFSDFKENPIDSIKIMSIERENKFKNKVEVLDIKGIELFLKNIFDEIKREDDVNSREIFNICRKIINIFLDTANRMGFKKEISKKTKKEIAIKLHEALSIEEIHKYLKEILLERIDEIAEKKKSKEIKPIREAKNYIRENYNKQIKLKDVAKVVNYNSSYLSYIFKKEVGMNFSEYLINCRLNKAKDMLKNYDNRITFISKKVGYKDPKYFSKLFKKKIGVKPSEYRKLYS